MTGFGNERSPISTLVFMDLEATGLPSFVGRRNVHITEMSFVAIDRESFETDSSQRVINKLSLCVRPRSTISHGAMEVTGLYNDVLENQNKFDDSVPKLLEYFFRRLRTPICLLAHNGKKYDFPLLQAELKNINYALDPKILCADTLEAIRHIVLNPSVEPSPEKIEPCHSKAIIEKPQQIIEKDNDPEIEILLTQDIDLFKNITEPCDDNDKDPQTVTTPQHIKKTYHTPTNPTHSHTPFTTNFHKRLKLDTDSPLKTPETKNTRSTLVRRNLFPDTSGKNNVATPSRPQFSLEKLYLRFFGESPKQSHYAEADCIALSKVCQKVSPEFLKWIDNNSQPFCETKAMW